ncbi:hypothetical protein Tco_1295675 [Tanacetum coccineum]
MTMWKSSSVISSNSTAVDVAGMKKKPNIAEAFGKSNHIYVRRSYTLSWKTLSRRFFKSMLIHNYSILLYNGPDRTGYIKDGVVMPHSS